MNRREFLCLSGAGICLSASGCSKKSIPDGKPVNIVVALIDQLRKDSSDKWSKQLTDLSRKGVRFEEMRSVAPWTYPSVISMMSGLYPQQHGADGHLVAKVLTRFNKSVPLIQETLQRSGYKTAAFITNPFLHTWNHFHRNFDHFDGHFIHNTGNIRPKGHQYAIPEKMFSHSVNKSIKQHFNRESVKKPEFTYIHYIDVHGPWESAPFQPNYRASIEYTDQQVTDIYRFFMERYEGNVLFLVTSDHGRSLGNDIRLGYGKPWRKNKHSCHEFNLRIPFYLLPSKVIPKPLEVPAPCSNVDFVPTILDIVGVKPAYKMVGRSLAPWIRGNPSPVVDRPIYSKVSAFGGFGDSLTLGHHKLIRYFNFKSKQLVLSRLFDLENDPRETVALEQSNADIAKHMDTESGDHLPRFEPEDRGKLPPETEKQLRALGYLK
jgi:arylsulfatase A-like enzyme